MRFRGKILLPCVILALTSVSSYASTQQLPRRTADTDAEAVRLMRNEKLDLILPGALRDNGVDMWIHVTRGDDPDPLALQFGRTAGYLIFTDRGDRIERAVFDRGGAVEKIDVRGSAELGLAISGYDHPPGVYGEITRFVEERDPQVIAVNTSEMETVADGISHSEYLKLERILGPTYSARIVSAEGVIRDFLLRRTAREVAAQVEVLALARQRAKENLSKVVPGVTTIADINARVYYSAVNPPEETVPISTPDVRWFIHNPDYVLQRGDLFVGGGEGPGGEYMGFGVDTKIHAYILREGETKVPDFLQDVYEKAIVGQWILRDHMKVGMTAKESLDAMVVAMEAEGYVYTPFRDIGTQDYEMIQEALAGTDKPGFSIDNHAFGNYGDMGPSMAAFRSNTHDQRIQDNHLFAFEYMVHMNIAERPGYPLAFNISNPQLITSKGVEFIQPLNEEIFLIH